MYNNRRLKHLYPACSTQSNRTWQFRPLRTWRATRTSSLERWASEGIPSPTKRSCLAPVGTGALLLLVGIMLNATMADLTSATFLIQVTNFHCSEDMIIVLATGTWTKIYGSIRWLSKTSSLLKILLYHKLPNAWIETWSNNPTSGLFDKTSLGEGTTHKNHFPAPPATKGPNLRPKTGILLGKDNFVPKSCYTKHFDGIKEVYNVSWIQWWQQTVQHVFKDINGHGNI